MEGAHLSPSLLYPLKGRQPREKIRGMANLSLIPLRLLSVGKPEEKILGARSSFAGCFYTSFRSVIPGKDGTGLSFSEVIAVS